jgi:hypothetical protein
VTEVNCWRATCCDSLRLARSMPALAMLIEGESFSDANQGPLCYCVVDISKILFHREQRTTLIRELRRLISVPLMTLPSIHGPKLLASCREALPSPQPLPLPLGPCSSQISFHVPWRSILDLISYIHPSLASILLALCLPALTGFPHS